MYPFGIIKKRVIIASMQRNFFSFFQKFIIHLIFILIHNFSFSSHDINPSSWNNREESDNKKYAKNILLFSKINCS